MHKVIDGIDDDPLEIMELEYTRMGDTAKAEEMKEQFLQNAGKLKDHCSCPEPCRHHGNCYECVILHRGHGDHLPYCMWSIVNKKLADISKITENSIKEEL